MYAQNCVVFTAEVQDTLQENMFFAPNAKHRRKYNVGSLLQNH